MINQKLFINCHTTRILIIYIIRTFLIIAAVQVQFAIIFYIDAGPQDSFFELPPWGLHVLPRALQTHARSSAFSMKEYAHALCYQQTHHCIWRCCWIHIINPLTPVPPVTARDEPWSFFRSWRHHFWPRLASSILNFRRRKRSFQWCVVHSDRLIEALNMHKNAQKVERKTQSQISCLRHVKIYGFSQWQKS